MNTMFRTTAIALALAAAPLAMAQSTPAPDNRPPMAQRGPQGHGPQAHGPQGQGPHGQQARIAPAERIDARLAYAQTALKITDAQKPQWEIFANVVRKQAKDMEARMAQRHEDMQKGDQRQLSAIDRLERRQQFMAEASKRMSELIAAGKPLYATLSPEQQKVADDLLNQAGPGGHHRPAAFHRHGGEGRGMGPGMNPGNMGPGQMGPGQMGPGRGMGPGMQPGA